MDAQKRQVGIGDGIDEVLDDGRFRTRQRVVFAPKWDDPVLDGQAREAGETVRLQAGAGDEIIGGDRASVLGADCDPCPIFGDGVGSGPKPDFAAGGPELLGHREADPAIVDDTGGMNEQRAKAGDVGFDLAQAGGRNGIEGDVVFARPRF